MSLSVIISDIVKEEIQKDIEKEISEKEYLPQSAFTDCTSRAEAMMYNAVARAKKVYALAILLHRENSHGEDHKKEKEELVSTMPAEDIELSSTPGFWNN